MSGNFDANFVFWMFALMSSGVILTILGFIVLGLWEQNLMNLPTPPSKSLDATGGSVFLNLARTTLPD